MKLKSTNLKNVNIFETYKRNNKYIHWKRVHYKTQSSVVQLVRADRFEEHLVLRVLLHQSSEQIKHNHSGLELCINLTV